MKISCNILKKHIKNCDDIDWLKIWDKFTIRTAEVEDVTIKGYDLKDVVVAEILQCDKHPKKDKYHILKVDNGDKIVDILCGAPNVRKRMKVPMVKVGGMVAGITIEEKEIAGVLSQGMLCSGRELGISENHEGILELPDDYVVGKSIKDYLPIDDIIVEIDNKSLTHRPDLWGHYGIAREIAAITNHEILPLALAEIPNTGKKLDVKINDSKLCPRYTGLKIENITNNKTPFDIQIGLYYTGSRSISLLVDLTNYVMCELGQPMHAFDARKVESIEVGLAKEGDVFTTLDRLERKMSGEDLMIKKNNEYFGIAGIMGGLDSEIEEDTSSIILESANFDPFTIRKTSIRLGLRTDASARYEKSLDPNLTEIATKRFVYLLKNIDNNIVFASKLTDVYPNPLKEGKIKLFKDTIYKNIKEELSDEFIVNILNSLGFKTKVLKSYYEVIVPTYRHTKDISIEADLIEEIARMYGYENIKKDPLKLNMIINNVATPYKLYYKIKRYLATKYNMNEVNTYLWNKSYFLNRLNIEKNNVKLLGKSEDNILRDDLTLSLLEVASRNVNNYDQFKIFEIGTIIENNNNKNVLSFLNVDSITKVENVYNLTKEILFNLVKTIKNIKIDFIKESCNEYYNSNLSLGVYTRGIKVGCIKVLENKYATLIGKKKIFIAGELNLDVLFNLENERVIYKDISKYPMVTLDYTIIADKNTKYDIINNILSGFQSSIIIKYLLIDRFESENEMRFTFRYIIGSREKTLEQKEIEDFKNKLLDYLEKSNFKIVQ